MKEVVSFIKSFVRPIRKILTKVIIEPSVLYPHISKQLWHETNAFRWAAAYVVKNQIEGDYLEFGVYKGTSFIETYNQISDYSNAFYQGGAKSTGKENIFMNMKFHAFDSFEGLPETKNTSNPIQYFPGAYSASEKLFRDRISAAGLDMSKVTITNGWFNESLNNETASRLMLDKIAIAYIDCDIYESSVDVLEFISPYLRTGSVLVFDDWFRNKGISSNGVQGAVLEWLEKNSNITLQHFYNSDTRTAVFIVKIDNEIKVSNIECV
tara:strand:- start:1019 stop:1819 length:801 start_codon:yes stop_codon:yes gene_type:complete